MTINFPFFDTRCLIFHKLRDFSRNRTGCLCRNATEAQKDNLTLAFDAAERGDEEELLRLVRLGVDVWTPKKVSNKRFASIYTRSPLKFPSCVTLYEPWCVAPAADETGNLNAKYCKGIRKVPTLS
ncbi:MAG: hypothetical protein Q4D38_02775 [Planctomycetia bacterium]|nr:hypothetical protein [Planctomycetia bacterium]